MATSGDFRMTHEEAELKDYMDLYFFLQLLWQLVGDCKFVEEDFVINLNCDFLDH